MGEPSAVAAELRKTAEEIKEGSGWFGELRSPLRLIVSALLVLNGDRAGDFLSEVERAKKLFRAVDLRQGRIYETMAILILRIQQELQPIQEETVQRFKEI